MSVNPIPHGYHTITPYLAVPGAKALLEFLEAAFDAEVKHCSEAGGIVHNAEVKIGTSMIMVGDSTGRGPDRPSSPAMLYMYVKDVDQAYAQAVKAGGKSIMEPIDHFYGDRSGAVEDPSGNQWWIATHIKDVAKEEIARLMAAKK